MFKGVVGGFVIYALGVGMGYLLPGDVGLYTSMALIAGSIVFSVAWAVVVWRGWLPGQRATRSQKRRKGRERDANPWSRR